MTAPSGTIQAWVTTPVYPLFRTSGFMPITTGARQRRLDERGDHDHVTAPSGVVHLWFTTMPFHLSHSSRPPHDHVSFESVWVFLECSTHQGRVLPLFFVLFSSLSITISIRPSNISASALSGMGGGATITWQPHQGCYTRGSPLCFTIAAIHADT